MDFLGGSVAGWFEKGLDIDNEDIHVVDSSACSDVSKGLLHEKREMWIPPHKVPKYTSRKSSVHIRVQIEA